MTGHNTLFIDLIKPTGEQAIMNSPYLAENSEIYEMIIWSCSLSYLYPQFIIQEHCKALKVLKNVGNHEELLKTVNH